MIDEEANEYSAILQARHTFHCCLPTVDVTERDLKSLFEDNALGPDMLPTRILKICAHALAPVLHVLIFAILTCGERPALWMEHWIIPVYKRKSVYQARHYKGIHFIYCR